MAEVEKKLQSHIPEKIRERHPTIYQFHKESGLSWPTAWKLSKGRLPSMRTLERMCGYFDTEVQELITYE